MSAPKFADPIWNMLFPGWQKTVAEMDRNNPVPKLERIASALERIADRFDSDAKEFNEMVEKGKNLSA
jgi:hypothetical protein